MVRKAPATTKPKGSPQNETRMPGIAGKADYLQEMEYTDGLSLDQSLANAANETMADKLGLDDTEFKKK